jgi:regulator of sirC expression with transglutaminase-like and TPR domain
MAYSACGQHQSAAKDFQKYLELIPNAPNAFQLRIYIQQHLK